MSRAWSRDTQPDDNWRAESWWEEGQGARVIFFDFLMAIVQTFVPVHQVQIGVVVKVL